MTRGPAPRIALLAALAFLGSCGGGGGAGGTRSCDPPGNYPVGVYRGPQLALPTPTSMTIAWTTTTSVIGAVEYGATSGYGSSVVESSPTTSHQISVSPLSPATTYHYRIDDAAAPAGGDHTFTTPPSSAATTARFAVIGDSGTGCPEEYDAIARIAAFGPDFVLGTGDMAYFDGTPFEVHFRYTIPFAPLSEAVPVFPCLGNHDVSTANGQPFLDAIVLPTNLADGTEHYYSFDWGPCHVVALDSNQDASVGSLQRAWLDTDLASSSAAWKFVFFHHPPYSSSSHGSELALRAALGPVFDARHVDVVFNGHDHDYERTYPMLASVATDAVEEPDFVSPAGTVYVVTGGGGQDLYPSGTSSFTAFSRSVHHVVQADVVGNVLTITALQIDGTILDRMSITK